MPTLLDPLQLQPRKDEKGLRTAQIPPFTTWYQGLGSPSRYGVRRALVPKQNSALYTTAPTDASATPVILSAKSGHTVKRNVLLLRVR